MIKIFLNLRLAIVDLNYFNLDFLPRLNIFVNAKPRDWDLHKAISERKILVCSTRNQASVVK
ncbi:hypothetical protein [Candidatus Desulfofervidus auxilii]|uniref:hypothetical protein n=1 Tax=Desulfofervidus auxilii TaxID=1621989 RepID=UPI00155E9901|nr:hypothetical protein [Candidatus Desulfofervidus auxilii]